jgi:hypothetical protein
MKEECINTYIEKEYKKMLRSLIIQLLQLKLYNHQERIPYYEKLHVVK